VSKVPEQWLRTEIVSCSSRHIVDAWYQAYGVRFKEDPSSPDSTYADYMKTKGAPMAPHATRVLLREEQFEIRPQVWIAERWAFAIIEKLASEPGALEEDEIPGSWKLTLMPKRWDDAQAWKLIDAAYNDEEIRDYFLGLLALNVDTYGFGEAARKRFP
jgi:hypothetical protein